jgi:hypothetical protein
LHQTAARWRQRVARGGLAKSGGDAQTREGRDDQHEQHEQYPSRPAQESGDHNGLATRIAIDQITFVVAKAAAPVMKIRHAGSQRS